MRWGEILRDQLPPAIVTLGGWGIQKWQDWHLLPINPRIRDDYAVFGLFLAFLATVVSAGTYASAGRRYTLVPFSVTAIVTLLTLIPFVASRYDVALGLPPEVFAILATYSYLLLHITVGVLIGGAWSVLSKTMFPRI